MDNLEMDMIRCQQDGFGPHYGAWKALHPNTKEENVPLIEAYEQELKRAKARKKREPRRCPICGKVIPPQKGNIKFCSFECRKKNEYRLSQERQRKKAEEREREKHCAWCGASFVSANPRKMYCGEACKYAAKLARAKDLRHELKKGGKTNG